MTCIVGLVHDGITYIGGDSAGVSESSLKIRSDQKVFVKGEFVFGFTTSFRMGQILKYKFNIPSFQGGDVLEYMHTDFIDHVIQCFSENKFLEMKNEVAYGGHFMVGFKGHLFHVESDFQIGFSNSGYNSIGCGSDVALGCMYGLADSELHPEKKILLSLKASENFNSCVRGPFAVTNNSLQRY